MAQGNLCVAADRISRLLGSEDVEEVGSLLGSVGHELLKGLEDTISSLAPKLVDVEKKRIDDEGHKDWLMRLEDAVYDADNLLEDLSTTEALRRRSMTRRKKMANQVCSLFSNSKSKSTLPASLQLKRHQIEGIKERLDGIAAEGEAFHLEERSDERVLINWEEDTIAIRNHLLMDHWNNIYNISKERPNDIAKVLAIVGVDGIGETALARDVFFDERVQSHFEVKIWLDVSHHNFDPKQVLKEIVVRASSSGDEKITEEHRMEMLQLLLISSLYFKRYLIVLDGVWTEDLEKWQSLIDVLENVSTFSKCRIIVTTRSMEVAISLRCTTLAYPLQILDKEQSWVFFKMVVGVGQEPKISNYQMQVGREMVNKCMGLPIAITTIGWMLRLKNSDQEWQFFHESLDERLMLTYSIYSKLIWRMLKVSYDQLPSPLKPCFAYCSLFPKDYEIDVQTLIKLWMAQGFIIDQAGKSLEDTGYSEYFLGLLDRFFFREADKDLRGRVTKCRMHDLIRDLAIYVAEDRCLVLSSSGSEINRTFHVSFHFDLFSAKDIPTPSTHEEEVRSILLPGQSQRKHRGIPDNTIPGIIISRFRYLRALDMHDLGIKILPNSIGKLKLLKYLDLSENEDIRELPNSITKLLNLQTLKLSSCFGLKKLPRGFKNLTNLRHLEIDGCYNLTGVLQEIAQLPNLQISQLVVSEETSVRDCELNAVTAAIDKLHIKNLGHEKNNMAKYLKLTSQARSLSLDWETHAPKSDEEKMLLDSSRISAVEELSLHGFKAATLFSDGLLHSSNNLVKLSLWRCENCEILPPLHQMPNLKVLILDEIPKLEYISDSNEASSSIMLLHVYPSLKEVWLTELPKLKGWWKSRGNEDCSECFFCLSKLVIERCPDLKSMPLFPTLEEELVLDTTCWKPFQLTATSSNIPNPSSSPPLSKLKKLCIAGIDDCKEELGIQSSPLKSTEDNNYSKRIRWDVFKSLLYLKFDCLPKLETLPVLLQNLTNLQELHVSRSALKEIPKWIVQLKNLRKMVIRLCPHLNLLPKEICGLLTSHTLLIEDCPALLL